MLAAGCGQVTETLSSAQGGHQPPQGQASTVVLTELAAGATAAPKGASSLQLGLHLAPSSLLCDPGPRSGEPGSQAPLRRFISRSQAPLPRPQLEDALSGPMLTPCLPSRAWRRKADKFRRVRDSKPRAQPDAHRHRPGQNTAVTPAARVRGKPMPQRRAQSRGPLAGWTHHPGQLALLRVLGRARAERGLPRKQRDGGGDEAGQGTHLESRGPLGLGTASRVTICLLSRHPALCELEALLILTE